MSSATTRPANRPSRRHELVRGAVDLFALQPWDVVTVDDIVASAGMTSAAFYYHFDSKIQLLEEVVSESAPGWEAVVADALATVQRLEDFDDLAATVLAWLDDNLSLATVLLVHAPGASEAIDQVVEDMRTTLVHDAAEVVGRLEPAFADARRDVVALALINALELAAASRLQLDDVYRTLGPRRFMAEVAKLARLIVGTAEG